MYGCLELDGSILAGGGAVGPADNLIYLGDAAMLLMFRNILLCEFAVLSKNTRCV